MANANKVILKNSEARLSKLKNKKSQLENLLRSRERLDYEIKNLKKSIQKDNKIITEEFEKLENFDDESLTDEDLQVLEESQLPFLLEESRSPQETYQKLIRLLVDSKSELILILELLLKFAETL